MCAAREVVCDSSGDGLVKLRGRGILVQTGVQVLHRVLGVGTRGGRSSRRSSRSGGIVGTAIVMTRSRRRWKLLSDRKEKKDALETTTYTCRSE